jgi:hypothetical protein
MRSQSSRRQVGRHAEEWAPQILDANAAEMLLELPIQLATFGKCEEG